MSKSVDELKAKRTSIKCSLTRHQTAISLHAIGDKPGPIKARITNINELFAQYNQVQEEIEKHIPQTEADVEPWELENSSDRVKIENQYYNLIAAIEDIVCHSQIQTNQANESSTIINITRPNGSHTEVSSMLKPLPLPKFYGEYSEWASFFDTFQCLVHDDVNLSKVQKFRYLRSCLKDEALLAISSLKVTNENYEAALKILRDQFENHRVVIHDHVDHIINLAPLVKPNSTDIQHFINIVNANLTALKILNVETDSWNAILVQLLVTKLDYVTKREWQLSLKKELPTTTELLDFLKHRCDVLRALTKLNSQPHQKPKGDVRGSNAASKGTNPKAISCSICENSHMTFMCTTFLNLSVADRVTKVKERNLCLNCLRPKHQADSCYSKHTCKTCKQRHHTLLHTEEPVQARNALHVSGIGKVLLSTVKLLVADANGGYRYCRALLDQGSEVNIITRKLANELRLPTIPSRTSIAGVGSNENNVTQMMTISAKSSVTEYAFVADYFVLTTIAIATPSTSINKQSIRYPDHVKLADSDFHLSEKVDLLLGASIFWKILSGPPVQHGTDQPFMQKTRLGWIFGGDIPSDDNDDNEENIPRSCNLTQCCPTSLLNAQLEKMWQEPFFKPAQIEDECEDHYKATTTRQPDGSYSVRLPFKPQAELGDSRTSAVRQFFRLERRLEKNNTLKKEYSDFMKEYAALGHMQEITPDDVENAPHYYLPHHPVFKLTTHGPKLRVVFNASSKTSNGSSLNDVLLTGPALQEDLVSILLRFRLNQFVLTGDITKMYRMIYVHKNDCDYQLIVWRDDADAPLKTYKLLTVTYGTSPAPFLAIRTLHEVAHQGQESHPVASAIILKDFYVDDVVTGANTPQQLLTAKNELTELLASSNFTICKWASNCPSITNSANSNTIQFVEEETVKVLGFFWRCNTDQLSYQLNAPQTDIITKRTILAEVARIFDPLGLINPIIVKIRILIQGLWISKHGWDDEVPETIATEWTKIINDFEHLRHLHIPRWISRSVPLAIELHGFADASTKAYGCAIYLKSIYNDGASVQLLCAKSRLAPVKTITLPRLELNAAVLASDITNRVTTDIGHVGNTYLWTDSTITLAWIARNPVTLNCYVANRVSKIQTLSTTATWRHVRSHDNPADIVSRGISGEQISQCPLWWNGPGWLVQNIDEWPRQPTGTPPSDQELEVKRSVLVVVEDPELTIISKYASFYKLCKIVAHLKRFVNNWRAKNRLEDQRTGNLQLEEITQAKISILKYVQQRAFKTVISTLKIKGSQLSSLDPFLDTEGLLRVGGRIRSAPLTYTKRHPIILPAGHHITRTIIREIHTSNLHCGPEATLAAVREQYWPLSGRRMVRQIVHSCIPCFKAKPKKLTQKMGNLPSTRMTATRPFSTTGVDYAGPFLVKPSNSRTKTRLKAYVAVFVCFSSRAVHLELAGDLSTPSFLAALRRFTSRRGHASHIYCDNGTNFTGAARELLKQTTYQDTVNNYCNAQATKFHFIPPRSPHMGGIWERTVRSVKHHLTRVVAHASLTYEEFTTFLASCEACLNSRPITPLSDNPNDMEPLTPSHFLVGGALTSPAETDLQDTAENRLTRWQRVQQLRQHFWRRWQREYISQMQQRPKGARDALPNIAVGDLVLISEDNLPPLRWKLGRVSETHPGADGLVRVATVRTPEGTFKRAVKKLCALPRE